MKTCCPRLEKGERIETGHKMEAYGTGNPHSNQCEFQKAECASSGEACQHSPKTRRTDVSSATPTTLN